MHYYMSSNYVTLHTPVISFKICTEQIISISMNSNLIQPNLIINVFKKLFLIKSPILAIIIS